MSPQQALSPGHSGVLLIPSDLVNYRLNVGVRTLTDVALTLTVRNAAGSVAASVPKFFPAVYHEQQTATAFLNGLVPSVRFRLFSRKDFTLFLDAGAGVSWSDTTTPPRGTRFNFLLIVSSGFMYKLTPQIYAVASARLLHLSNASLMGRDRNPDIEALGGTFGIYFGF